MLQDSSASSGEIPLLRTRLSVQMFIQFATWGIWLPVLGNHLGSLKIPGEQIGYVYGTGPLALMIAPLIAGQIADRYFATQQYLSISYFLSGGLFLALASATDYNAIWWLALCSMIFFGPTLGLANSLCFHHLKNPERDFAYVRVWGTIGWIAAGWGLTGWLYFNNTRPIGDCFTIAGVLSIINGCYSLSLPHTPPKGKGGAFPLARVLAALKEPSFAVFCLLAFLALIFATFYYNYNGLFFEKGMKIEQKYIPAVASIGQVMEILTMYILPFFLTRLGFKTTIAIGIVAWGLRFTIFAMGEPTALVIAAQALHGVCFAFAIAAAMIYVDKVSTPDIKGSMQSFLAFITYGVGMFVGSILAAKVFAFSSKPIPNSTETAINWLYIWFVPAAGCGVALLLFLIGFKAKDKPSTVTLAEEAEDAPPANI